MGGNKKGAKIYWKGNL